MGWRLIRRGSAAPGQDAVGRALPVSTEEEVIPNLRRTAVSVLMAVAAMGFAGCTTAADPVPASSDQSGSAASADTTAEYAAWWAGQPDTQRAFNCDFYRTSPYAYEDMGVLLNISEEDFGQFMDDACAGVVYDKDEYRTDTARGLLEGAWIDMTAAGQQSFCDDFAVDPQGAYLEGLSDAWRQTVDYDVFRAFMIDHCTSDTPGTEAAGGSTGRVSDPPSPDEATDASPDVVTLKSSDEMTLEAVWAAAEADSCRSCVSSTGSGGAEQESARRGLAQVRIGDAEGLTGAVFLYGYSGTQWQPLSATQGDERFPSRLPEPIWICVDESSTNLRAGPGTEYPVIGRVTRPTEAQATFFRLTTAESEDDEGNPVDGEGWFEVSFDQTRAWVSSTRIFHQYYENDEAWSSGGGCGIWRRWTD